MSSELPATANEIAEVFEMGGQLGIANESLEKFARTIIDISESTNLSTEQAATQFARFANILEMSEDNFDRLGSTIVGLGNSMATTESEIMEMTMRLAGQGKQVGLLEPEIVALAAAMSSVGINAEAGGSSMSMILRKINDDVMDAGGGLEYLAKISGVSAKQFAGSWEDNPIYALDLLIQGIRKVSDEGGNAASVLEKLGFKGIYERDTMLRLAGASELLGEAVETGWKSWNENVALVDEANERYATTESQLRMLKNEVTAVAIQFGEIMIPILLDVVKALKPVVQWFADLTDGQKKMILGIGAFIAIVGPLLMALGSIISAIGTLVGVFGNIFGIGAKVVGTFARVGGAVARFLPIIGRLSSIGRLLHPVGLAITGIILLFKGLLKYFDMTPKNIIDGLVLGFTKGIPLLWEAAKDMGMAIINKFKEVLGIQSPSTVFYDFGVWIIEGLINGINAMVQFVVDLFVRLVETITGIIVNFVTWIINKMIEMKDRVVEKVTEMVTNVINKFREMVQGAIQAGKEIVSAIVGAFQNAWNGAKEFVSKAASLGVDFARGIANGITSGAKWIKDAIIGIGKSAVKAFKNFFDIQSPSRVMAKEAEWIPAGIAKGIESGGRKATGTLVKLGERMNIGYKRINENAKKQAKRMTNNLKRYYDQATGMMRYVAQPIKRASNAMKPRPMVAAAVAQPRGGKGNLGRPAGSVNVNVRRLENVNNKTIQNKVERGFFNKARQRE